MRARPKLEPLPREHGAAAAARVPRRDDRASRPPTTPTCSACRRCRRGRSPEFTDRRRRRAPGARARCRSPRGSAARSPTLNHGVLRSAFSGQGNAILLSPRLRVLEHRSSTLNPRRFRDAQARRSGSARRAARVGEGAPDRAGRAPRDAGRPHVPRREPALHELPARPSGSPDAELLRAAWFASSVAEPEDVVVLAGDFNVTADALAHAARAHRAGVGVLAARARASTTSSSGARPRRRCGAGRTRSGGTTGASCPIMRRWRSRSMQRVSVDWPEASARAFPVLERYAYLNAGHVRPALARDARRDGDAARVGGRARPRRPSVLRRDARTRATRARAARRPDPRSGRARRDDRLDDAGRAHRRRWASRSGRATRS